MAIIEKFVAEFTESINAFTKAYNILDPDKQRLTEMLGHRGWFFTIATTPGFWVTVLGHMKFEEYQEVDELFVDWYEKETTEIFERLIRIYPAIKDGLSEAQKCLSLELYNAAIPLMLILCEYIANVNTSKLLAEPKTHILFSKKKLDNNKKITKVEYYLGDRIAKDDRFSFKNILAKEHSFNEPQSNTNASKVNRHAILHGCNIAYANRLNALKTLCFLDYVDLTLGRLHYKKT